MSIFNRKKTVTKAVEPPQVPKAPEVPHESKITEDNGEEIAAVIAAICSMSGISHSRLIVRNIVRVPEQSTNWNRLIPVND